MSRKSWVLGVLIMTLAVLEGCASIISGSTQEMSFASEPPGATVSFRGEILGETPCKVSLKRGREGTLKFSKEGYQTLEVPMEQMMNPVVWVNIVFLDLGVLSSTTDANSGAFHKYKESDYYVTLTPVAGIKDVQHQVKDFVVLNFDRLVAESHRGDGEYLRSLALLLAVDDTGYASLVAEVRALGGERDGIGAAEALLSNHSKAS